MKNVGQIDKLLRIFVGVGILGAGYFYGSYWGLVGVLPIGTALVGVCPAYSLFGFKTCKKEINELGD